MENIQVSLSMLIALSIEGVTTTCKLADNTTHACWIEHLGKRGPLADAFLSWPGFSQRKYK